MTPDASSGAAEWQIALDAQEAATGAIKQLSLPTPSGGQRVVTFRIPAGVHDGALVRVPGQGETAGPGERSNDLFVRVRVAAAARQQGSDDEAVFRKVVLIGLVALLTLGGVAVVLQRSRGDDDRIAGPLRSPSPSSSYEGWSATPYVPPMTDEPVDIPTSRVLLDDLDGVNVHDCVRNHGTQANADFQPSACESGAFEVLYKQYGMIDNSACYGGRGITHSLTGLVDRDRCHQRLRTSVPPRSHSVPYARNDNATTIFPASA